MCDRLHRDAGISKHREWRMDLDEILLTTEESMEKAVDYLKNELRGVLRLAYGPALTGDDQRARTDATAHQAL